MTKGRSQEISRWEIRYCYFNRTQQIASKMELESSGVQPVPNPSSLQKEYRKMVKVNQEVTPEKRIELEGILDLHHDTFTDVPKKTNVMEVNFKLCTDIPITSKPYPALLTVRFGSTYQRKMGQSDSVLTTQN